MKHLLQYFHMVGPGSAGLPFVLEVFLFVKVYGMVIRAFLLKYIFLDKHC